MGASIFTGLLSSSGEWVQPNLHVAVVHFPVALLAAGLAAEWVTLLVARRAESLRSAGRWMMLLGAMACLPVAFSGVYALADLARGAGGSAATAWHELRSAALAPGVLDALVWHGQVQAAASAVALLVTTWFLACSDGARRALYLPLLLAMTAAVGATLYGAHVGGQAVYRHGAGVAAGAYDRASAHDAEPDSEDSRNEGTGTTRPTTAAAAVERLTQATPPLQLHALVSGAAISLGLAAFACAWRNTALIRAAEKAPKRPVGPVPGSSRFEPPPKAVDKLPASRLLLLAAALVVVAGAVGTWHLSRESQTTVPRELWEMVLTFPPGEALAPENRDMLRRPAHVALGAVLLAAPLLMALWAWLRPRARFVLFVSTVLFLAAAVAQSGVGTLLLLDGPVGPINTPATK